MRISTVKLVFSFSSNAKFKDITCIVDHRRGGFILQTKVAQSSFNY